MIGNKISGPPSAVAFSMSTVVGGRLVEPALPVVDATHPTDLETSFAATLQSYADDGNIPLESTEGIQRRERALNRMGQLARDWIQSVCRRKGFSDEVAEAAGGQLFTSGSYRLGVHEPGADIDTILVAPNMCTRQDFFGQVLEESEDGTVLKRDPESLAERIRVHPDVTNFVPVEGAAVPILTFDWEGVNIDLLFARLNSAAVSKSLDIDNDSVLDGVDSATEKSLNGPRVTNLIASLVSGSGKHPERYQTFLQVVRCVRKWCKARGLYSNKMGYWGGVNINICVALCCQLYPNDTSASLLRKFFLVFKSWRWPNPVLLTKPHDAGYGLTVWSPQHSHRQVAPIITPAYPAMNSTLAVSRQTLQILHEEIARGHAIVDKLWKTHKEDPSAKLNWDDLFAPSDFFIHYPYYLSLCIVGPTQADAQAWAGFVESRFRKLISDLLGRSLPLSKIQLWPKKFEACVADKGALLTRAQRENSITYFVGFHVDRLRMRGNQLNVEISMNNFREWELSKFQPLVPGMDVVVKSFKVKELPRICFETFGGKEDAMKRRRQLRNDDPKRQEKRKLKRLRELKAKMLEMERKKAEKTKSVADEESEPPSEEERKRKRDDEVTEQEEPQPKVAKVEETESSTVEQDRKSKGSSDDTEENEPRSDAIKVENSLREVRPAEGAEEPPQEQEEANQLEIALDTVLGAEQKTREEAEADRRKLLAGEMLEESELPPSDDEADMMYTGDGARQTFVPKLRSTIQQHHDKRYMPMEKDEIDVLRRVGVTIVSDDEARTVGGNMIHPWRRQEEPARVKGKITFKSEFDIVKLDYQGHIIDMGDEDFQPSKSWTGRNAGFEFKLGARGLGYYRTGKKVVVPSNTAY